MLMMIILSAELLEKRKALVAEMQPPDFEALAKARKKRQNEIEMERIIKEIIIYFIFIMVLLYLSYNVKDKAGHNLYVTSKDIFWDNSPQIDGVSSHSLHSIFSVSLLRYYCSLQTTIRGSGYHALSK